MPAHFEDESTLTDQIGRCLTALDVMMNDAGPAANSIIGWFFLDGCLTNRVGADDNTRRALNPKTGSAHTCCPKRESQRCSRRLEGPAHYRLASGGER